MIVGKKNGTNKCKLVTASKLGDETLVVEFDVANDSLVKGGRNLFSSQNYSVEIVLEFLWLLIIFLLFLFFFFLYIFFGVGAFLVFVSPLFSSNLG